MCCYNLGIALSGGGIRGAVHLGVLNALKQNGICPDIISGTSAGSIAGAIYAAGLDLDDLKEGYKRLKLWDILDPTFTISFILTLIFYFWANKPMTMWTMPDGLYKGEKIEKQLDKLLCGKSFEDIKIPLSAVSVDIESGETVIFCPKKNVPKKGMDNTVFLTGHKLTTAVRASISLPGIFVPKKVNRRKLVDGGIKNNVPVDILHYQGAKKILAVDLSVTDTKTKANSMLEILMASVDIMWHEVSYNIKKNYPAYYIYPKVTGVGYKDYKKIPELVKYGEEIAKKEIPAIKRFLNS